MVPFDVSDNEAGPSSAAPLLFKKKKNRPARPATTSDKDTPQPPAAASAEEQTESSLPAIVQDDDSEDDEDKLTLDELVALRESHRAKPSGIELNRLNKGIRKKKKKQEQAKGGKMTEEERWKEQMEKGGLVDVAGMKSSRDDGEESDDGQDEEESSVSRSRRLVRQDNFQGETNVIDVDKHMMAYIEEEMRKRKAASAGEASTSGSGLSTSTDVQTVLSNPEDELYKVAEKYTRLQQEARQAAEASRLIATRSTNPDDEQGEGSIGLSSAMLSGIPEVELGMDSRLKNIEATEQAKRSMMEARRVASSNGRSDGAQEMLANARFFNPRHQARSDAEAMAAARGGTATGNSQTNDGNKKRSYGSTGGSGGDAGRATDDLVMSRFKKRQMQTMKR